MKSFLKPLSESIPRSALRTVIILLLGVGQQVEAHRGGVPFFLSLDGEDDRIALEVETDPRYFGVDEAAGENRPFSPKEQELLDAFVGSTLEILLDGEVIPWRPRATSAHFEPPSEEDSEEPVHVIAHYEMGRPETGSRISVRLSPETGSNLLLIYLKNGEPSRRHAILFPGETSRQWDLPEPEPEVVDSLAQMIDPPAQEEMVESLDQPEEPVAGEGARLLWRHLVEGFRHVLPAGWDHALFVVALVMLTRKVRPLLTQITVFTVAHSLTLGLAATGRVHLPSRWVEIVIALSIAVVAFESFRGQELRWRRLLLVLVFGLVHGVGFAGPFSDLPLPEGSFLLGLVGFNLGVEVAQVVLVLLVVGILAMVPMRHRRPIERTVCVVIGLAGLILALQRWVG